MFKVYAINPTDQFKTLIYKVCRAFSYKLEEIPNIGKVNERENMVVFCSEKDDNPEWVKIESLEYFEHPENAVYVFGADMGDVTKEIEDWIGDMKDKIRYVSIPMAKDGTIAIWACSACAIALYDRFIKRKKQ